MSAGNDIPDPQEDETFVSSILDWQEMPCEPHASVWQLYRQLITQRRAGSATRSHAAVSARPIDADTLVVERVLDDWRVSLCVARLRGAGAVEYMPVFGRCDGCVPSWSIECSTEDGSYAADPQPLNWDVGADGAHHVEFHRPGALLMISNPIGGTA